MNQFNFYKYNDLIQKFNIFSTGFTEKTLKIGYEIIEEWCWTYRRSELFIKWKQQYQRPASTCNNLTILHYNTRNYYTNQFDLIDMIENYKPAIISINELGTLVPLKTIEKALFSYKIFLAEGTNSHGGVILAIDKNLNPIDIDCQQQKNIVAASILVNNKTYTITSVYSPPTETLPLEIMSSIMQNSHDNIIMGDFNAKNYKWGCAQVNKKGRELESWLQSKTLHILNLGMTTSLRSKTTIDLIISIEQQCAVQYHKLPYNASDHVPVFTEFNNIKIKD
jgi:endonuclease/exonuclease/phosphatase (EEP) superfamily protein YafD